MNWFGTTTLGRFIGNLAGRTKHDAGGSRFGVAARSSDIEQGADGFYYGSSGARVCEDCWQPIPRYVDHPGGLTSPESDGDKGGNFAKFRMTAVEGKEGREALRKGVCLPCYFEAFRRVYPGAALPQLSDRKVGDL